MCSAWVCKHAIFSQFAYTCTLSWLFVYDVQKLRLACTDKIVLLQNCPREIVKLLDSICVAQCIKTLESEQANLKRIRISNWAKLKIKFDKDPYDEYNRYAWFEGVPA